MFPPIPNHDAWFEEVHGFPRPDWALFQDWVLKEVPADQHRRAWDGVTEIWFRRIQRSRPQYHFAASQYFHLLSPHSARECATMLNLAEQIYGRFAQTLGGLMNPQHGKICVLRFRDSDDYYPYVSYYQEGDQELPMSGGMCIAQGWPHVVCLSDTYEQFCSTFAHELTHLLVAHLPLPLWLNEGLAVSLEGEVGYSHLPNAEQIKKHRAHWNAETIQAFWSGESFNDPGEAFSLSYELAAVLLDVIRKELQPPEEALRTFIQSAVRRDAGAAAAQHHLRAELGELVEVFLGVGDWNPQTGC